MVGRGVKLLHSNRGDNMKNLSNDTKLAGRIYNNSEVALLDDLLSSRLKSSARTRTINDLFNRFSTLRRIVHAPGRTLKDTTISGDIAYQEIQKARNLAVALAKLEIKDRPVLQHYDKIIDYCRTILAGERRELFYVLFLNTAKELVGEKCLQSGTVNHVSVYPRELFNLAIEHSASAIILVHNHPGGCSLPSKADIKMTRILMEIGHYLGVKLADHIIISSTGNHSFLKMNTVEF